MSESSPRASPRSPGADSMSEISFYNGSFINTPSMSPSGTDAPSPRFEKVFKDLGWNDTGAGVSLYTALPFPELRQAQLAEMQETALDRSLPTGASNRPRDDSEIAECQDLGLDHRQKDAGGYDDSCIIDPFQSITMHAETSEQSVGEGPRPESVRDSMIANKPRRSGNSIRKMFKAVKQTLRNVWPDGDDENEGDLCWLYKPETYPPASENPFYDVRYGVRFQDIVPEKPSLFPYPSKMEYSSPYGSSILPADPTKGQDRAALAREEARQREKRNRKTLKKLKSFGRFRRRKNITLPMVEGRSTEPVEVARFRRAYSIPNLQHEHNDNKETLLEKVNRQVRAGSVEWTLTAVRPSTVDRVSASGMTEPRAVRVPSQGWKLVSRRSMSRTVSTRLQGRSFQRRNFSPASKSSLGASRGSHGRTRPLSRLSLHSADIASDMRLPTILKHTVAANRETTGELQVPELVITGPGVDVLQSPSLIAPLSLESAGLSLRPPRPAFHRERKSRMARRGLSSSSSSDNEAEAWSTGRRPGSLHSRSNRSSIYSTRSGVSRISTASSIPVSIYSTLSEDWNRPKYYAKSKSLRYPASLQTKIRILPPLAYVKASITSELVCAAQTSPQINRIAMITKARGLRNLDGSIIRPAVGDGLTEVEYRIVLQPIKNEVDEQDEDPTSAFVCPCKTAMSQSRDALGFMDYNDIGEDRDLGWGQRRSVTITTPKSHRERVIEKQPILDVNDVSAMAASGVDPSALHPYPDAFYNLHYAYFQEHGCFRDDVVDPEGSDVSSVSSSQFSGATGRMRQVLDQTDRQVEEAVGSRRLTRKVVSKSGGALKRAYKSFQTFVTGHASAPLSKRPRVKSEGVVEDMSETLPSNDEGSVVGTPDLP
ncbi:hypothetical protein BGZ58_006694 [Dissophora ornata]|nr:hypothetical protein BGZ58_006694 [Dissophora ornata]